MAEALEGDGVRLLLGARASTVSYAEGSFSLEVEGRDAPVTGERLLVATGRRPAVDAETWRALGLVGMTDLLYGDTSGLNSIVATLSTMVAISSTTPSIAAR